ncbi:molybdate ABC transporter permease subunit [Serpentinicella alkaliphila]|uniref:Molybdenum transport system permease n=1 Tax=Serpentinicella alkaliphila TaxID=1734049 RepID=A0A4R2U7I7_9FIRM|nr:molybdate ABC transporter permease subunit [Serpentinicella alkaliphila]QUH24742.1 molybdate ABC transporter permease subunit [Serpentinicella alkaliphila]TCQ03733.1 molybdate transport system permease protein [Serpentinicella alkaliphila]
MNWSPMYLSIKVASYSTLFTAIIGILIGWVLAKCKFYGKSVFSALVTLPMVLPPTVLGYYLLITIGRQSFIGKILIERLNINLIFTWKAAVIASIIVSLPLMIRSVQSSIESVDTTLEDVARTLGKSELSIFFRITLPLAWKGIVGGIVLAFARSMGEFGATLMVAGNIPGKTQTLSIAIYDAVQGGKYEQANFLVLLISSITIIALLFINKINMERKG